MQSDLWLGAFERALLEDARVRGYERGAGLQAFLPERAQRYDVFAR